MGNKEMDKIMKFYREYMPKEVYLMKNAKRYPLIEKATKEISELVLTYDQGAEIDIRPDELTGSTLCLSIKADLIVIDMVDKFCEALKTANTFEVCALTDGRASMNMTFQNAWVPAPPANEPFPEYYKDED